MRSLTQIPGWAVFILITGPFLAGIPFGGLFDLIGVFLSLYWIISVGKFGTLVLQSAHTTAFLVFNIFRRTIFISFLLHYYFRAGDQQLLNDLGGATTAFIIDIVLYVSLLTVTFYSAYIYNRSVDENRSWLHIIWIGLLFWLFPAGVWILQPGINKNIGEYLE